MYEDYAHHPSEIEATLRGARTLAHRRLVAVFQPHLYSRTALLAREFGRALALADVVVVLDVYPARERAEDHPGVSGLLIARASARRGGWAARVLAAELRRRRAGAAGGAEGGRRVRGDGRRATSTRWGTRWWRRCGEHLPAGVQRDYPLARLTTVRTGGTGEFFARAGSEQQLLELLAWAAVERVRR